MQRTQTAQLGWVLGELEGVVDKAVVDTVPGFGGEVSQQVELPLAQCGVFVTEGFGVAIAIDISDMLAKEKVL